jgi:hypothetical protein
VAWGYAEIEVVATFRNRWSRVNGISGRDLTEYANGQVLSQFLISVWRQIAVIRVAYTPQDVSNVVLMGLDRRLRDAYPFC